MSIGVIPKAICTPPPDGVSELEAMSADPSTPQQLPLHFAWREGLHFANYCPGDNRPAVAALRAAAEGAGERFVTLWGGAGLGKSHLLQAACEAAARQGRRGAYLPLAELAALSPAVLEGLEGLDLVCVDDLQAVAGEAAWEEALFHLYNRLREADGSLIAAADASPAGLPLRLPDLTSRLAWGPVYRLQPLGDADRAAALQARAAGRGLQLPDEVAAYLLRHCARDLPSLYALLDRLDQASLAEQRRLTIPFVRGLIG